MTMKFSKDNLDFEMAHKGFAELTSKREFNSMTEPEFFDAIQDVRQWFSPFESSTLTAWSKKSEASNAPYLDLSNYADSLQAFLDEIKAMDEDCYDETHMVLKESFWGFILKEDIPFLARRMEWARRFAFLAGASAAEALSMPSHSPMAFNMMASHFGHLVRASFILGMPKVAALYHIQCYSASKDAAALELLAEMESKC